MMAGGNGHKFRYVKLHLNTAKSLFSFFFLFLNSVCGQILDRAAQRGCAELVLVEVLETQLPPGQPFGADPAN